jgi:glycyl-tRNA synthetase
MTTSPDVFQKIVSHTKEHGFVFQSSELYDGLGAVYDYGPLGVLMKNNLRELWWTSMVRLQDNIVGLDAAILMHPQVWKASGHIDAFNDPLIDNKDSKKRYRADVLIEEFIEKLEQKSQKETDKKATKEGWSVDSDEYQRFLKGNRDAKKAQETQEKFSVAMENNDMVALKSLIEECGITCPESGTRNWTDVRQFNLMFKAQLGALAEESTDIYLRPETAQGIFVNFLNVQKSSRMKVPFGIAQTGKAFRNEIIARQFIFRMREFEQMEMQYFVKPGTQQQWYAYWKSERLKWHATLGLGVGKIRTHVHEKLAHYADAAEDLQFQFPFGFKELEGIHSRTDFDLKQHQELSGRKLQYFDPEENASYLPYVVETSIGLDRLFLAHLCDAFTEENVPSGNGSEETRTVLKLHPLVAPVKVAIFPLVKKDGLPEIAQILLNDLKYNFQVTYDEKDAVGRRYRRQDAKGTPFGITIDYDTLTDEAVTIRDRDSMLQTRVPLVQVKDWITKSLSLQSYFKESK